MPEYYKGKRYLTGCWDFINVDGIIKTVVRQFDEDAIWYDMPMDWEINPLIYSKLTRSNELEFKHAQRNATFYFDFINKNIKQNSYA